MVNLMDEQSNPTLQIMSSLSNYVVGEVFILIWSTCISQNKE